MNYTKRFFERLVRRTDNYLSWEEYLLRLNFMDDFYFAQNVYKQSVDNII
ncbi:MAG TPA: hypothetical protein PLX15_02020 [Candidatus Woesearchaeota archaeon]|jgi:hypothetical protein|nr:hypothetical protein [Candidatus Woesearchaeota archaeon]